MQKGPKAAISRNVGLTGIFSAHYNPLHPPHTHTQSQLILPDWKLQPCSEVRGHSLKLMPRDLPSQLSMVSSPGFRGYQSQASYCQRRVPLPGTPPS